MRELLRSRSVGWLRAGGFWTAVVLVLPNCSFDPSGLGSPNNLSKGSTPHNDLIFCDIERPEGRHCSTEDERARGIRLSEAAVALAEGRTTDVALDDSDAALARCGGQPEAVYFQGPFPQGFPVCLNCGEAIGTATQPTVTVACQRQCYDFFGSTDAEGDVIPTNPPTAETVAFCDANSRPSTSTANDMCFLGACDAGAVRADFVDPRINPEPVVWTDLIGAAPDGPGGNDLVRTAVTSGTFDAGAVSAQWISGGDAFIEFSAAQANNAVVLGLTEIPAACGPPCPDSDPSRASVGFAIAFGQTGLLYVFKSGVQVMGPGFDGSFGTYAANERFRVRLRDKGNGTAEVRYTRLVGACIPGTVCNETDVFADPDTASYPLRVDASVFEQNARASDVRLVRIR